MSPEKKGTVVFFDFDNTLTSFDVLDALIERFSINEDWKALERAWQAGRIGSKECLEGQLRSIRVTLLSRRPGTAPEGKFDRVLVDAPCSNTGVLARRPEARWRVTPAALRELTRIQAALFAAGLRSLRRGGRLVYSTCSLEPEENGDLAREILARRKGLRLLEERFRLPGGGVDGGYAALIEREGGP